MKTPNNRVLVFLVTIALFVTLIISTNAYNKKKVENEPREINESNLQIKVSNSANSTDSDKDGLNDWEEVLRDTDPNNPDTDGDGMSDGEEVALSRDPKVPGEGTSEEAAFEAYIQSVKDYNSDPDSLTGQVSLQLLEQLSSGGNSTEISQGLINQIQADIVAKDTYTKNNLIIYSDSSQENIQKYADAFIQIQNTEYAKLEAQTNLDPESYISTYENIALRLSTITIPSEISNIHLNFINNISKLAQLNKIVIDSEDDPAKVIAVISEIQKTVAAQELLSAQIKLYFENNGIILNNS